MVLRSIRTSLVPLQLVATPTTLAYLWGLSWAAGDFPERGQGTQVLADLGWLLGGILLGLVVGIAIPIILSVRHSFLLLVPVITTASFGVLVAGDGGAAHAARQVGCSVWGDVADAGDATLPGLAMGGVPTILLVGIIVGIGWLFRSRPSS